ncbi:MAG TPA: RHS repeat-associated core domain-containing protein [Verrucomicrobiae bacterium]|jgi:RHS repeat-associated protein|nr:RHS repeat-associated core domain-containing protein [Verrucomicrobiae bacterium]
MKLRTSSSVSILMVMFFSTFACAELPICQGPTCTPDMTASSYAGAVAARPMPLNARGNSNPIWPSSTAGIAKTVIGSQSYNFTIPILRMPGRAGMDLVLNLYYSSRIWNVDNVHHTTTFNIDRDYPSYGFRLDFGYLEKASSAFIITEGDGTKHNLANGSGTNNPMYYSTDGTHIQYNSSTGILIYKNGLTVQYLPFPSAASLLRPVWVKDSNGNYFSIAYVSGYDQLISAISDSLGRVVTFNYNASNELTSISMLVHPSGTKTFVTFAWGTLYGNGYAWYNFSGLTVHGTPALTTPLNVLTGCTYANGTGYKFSYGDWGIINEIDNLSSTGAVRSYVSYNFPPASQGALTDSPAYTQQTVSPDGTGANTSTWTYAVTKSGTGVVTSAAVTDPTGNSATTNLDPNTGLTSSVQQTNSSNTALRNSSYTWTTTGFPPVSTVLGSIVTTLSDTGQQSKVAYGYDPWANVTDVYEYDFGLTLLRHTVTTYLTTGDYVTFHVVDRPTQVLVEDATGNTVARTDMAYDGTSLTPVTGASSHDDTNYGSSFTTRGNLTSVTRYSNASAGTGAVARNFYYDTLGNLTTAQLDCCNQKTFNFSSTTQYSAPDSITRGPNGGPQFTTSYTYDPDTSALLSSTDENGQTTNYQYDSMGRAIQILLPPQPPPNGTRVQLNTVYGDDTVSPAVTSSNTANSAVGVTTKDGLGHVLQVDTKNGNAAVSTVKYAYDKLWQRTQASNPYAPGDTIVNTTFSYDALGRITQVTPPSAGYTQYSYSGNTVTVTDPAGKQRKNYSDALGRLIRVDEPGETFAGSPSAGSLTIGGTLQSQSGVGATPATPGTGSISFTSNTAGASTQCLPDNSVCDYGTIYLTVNGSGASTSWPNGALIGYPVQYLANTINQSNPYVTASFNGDLYNPAITLTAKTSGASTNYSFSGGSQGNYDGQSCTDASGNVYSPCFSAPFISTSASGASLTGGTDAYGGSTVYDSGTVTVTVGSFTASAPYGQSSNSTAAQVATALVGTGPTGLNRSGSPVTATANGAGISLNYKTIGAAGNVDIAASSSSNNSSMFPNGSFSGSSSLSGGVDPYSNTLSYPYATTYTYDVLNNLTAVSQAAGNVNDQPVAGQPRSYSYDSMGRLLTMTLPESSTETNYYTDASGNACSGDSSLRCRVQDARGVVKTFTYDGINRIIGVSYSDGTPSVSYTYDTGGASAYALDELTKITEGSNSQTFTYDNLGRITSVAQVIDSTTYTVVYGYNLASQVNSITYPTGRVVAQDYDAIGRLCAVGTTGSTCTSGTTYLTGLSYNAAGETTGLSLGNGAQGSFGYNDHLQMSSVRYSKSGNSSDILNLGYDYGSSNNGQIQAMHYYTSPGVEDATKSEYFNYDPWMRLSSAHTGTVNSTAGTWSLQWGYDRLGNRLSQALVGGNVSIGQPVYIVDAATNRITNSGYTYDAAGNMTNDSVTAYSYDGANRLKQINAGAATYTYFGPLRIKKAVGSNITVYIYSGTKPIVEYLNGSLSKEHIYAGSQLLATLAGSSTTYHHPDHLSNRIETNASGAPVRAFGHFPFGETWYETGSPDKLKFTTYEQDAESGLNYALFRYQAPRQGRFMSPDLIGGKSGAPQLLNGYSYALNDPVNLVDPFGLYVVAFESCSQVPWSSTTTWEDGSSVTSLGGFDTVCQTSLVGFGGGPSAIGPDDHLKDQVKAALKRLLKVLDPNCLKFLNSQGRDAQSYINDLITYADSGGIAVKEFPGTITETGPVNNPGTTVIGGTTTQHLTIDNAYTGGPDAALTVNSLGAFFNGSYKGIPLTTDRGRIKGDTMAAQDFIILHEVAHGTNAIKPDKGNQKMVDQNDKDLENNCKDTIKSFGKAK